MLEHITGSIKSLLQFQKQLFKKETPVLTSQALHLWMSKALVPAQKKEKKLDAPMLFI